MLLSYTILHREPYVTMMPIRPVRLGANYRTPEIDTSEVMVDVQWHFLTDYQLHFPMDCHVPSGFVLDISDGLSVAFSNDISLLTVLMCNLCPGRLHRIICTYFFYHSGGSFIGFATLDFSPFQVFAFTNIARLCLFHVRISKGFLTNKAPTNICLYESYSRCSYLHPACCEDLQRILSRTLLRELSSWGCLGASC